MKTKVSSAKRILFTALFALALPLLAGLPRLHAHATAAKKANPFDYVPANGEKIEEAAKPTVVMNMSQVELTREPNGTVRYIYKLRWKSWLERALYLVLLNIGLLFLVSALPKSEEHNLIISYFLLGVSLLLAFWAFLCGILLLMIKSATGMYVMPAGAAMWAATYYLMMRVKKADGAIADVAGSFKGLAGQGADPRLASVDGSPGDWPEQDFLK